MSIVINDYDGDESYYDERHGSYIIWLGKKGNRETNKMHELAHIRHGTDTIRRDKKGGVTAKAKRQQALQQEITDLIMYMLSGGNSKTMKK